MTACGSARYAASISGRERGGVALLGRSCKQANERCGVGTEWNRLSVRVLSSPFKAFSGFNNSGDGNEAADGFMKTCP